MKIGIIGPSKLKDEDKKYISKLAKIVAEKNIEIVLTPDKNSSSEYFAKKYTEYNGKKVFSVIPLDDKEFGYFWINLNIGEKINCNVWRNQPEKLNEECDALLCIGYSVGGLAEIAYTKWFGKKPVYIISEIEKEKLPFKINKLLDINYVNISEFENLLK